MLTQKVADVGGVLWDAINSKEGINLDYILQLSITPSYLKGTQSQ